jgi:hypothetical protein
MSQACCRGVLRTCISRSVHGAQFRALLEQAIAETIESLELGDADACCQVSDQVAVGSIEAITVRRSAHGERAPLQIPFLGAIIRKAAHLAQSGISGDER